MTSQAPISMESAGGERVLLTHLVSISKTVRQLVSLKLADCGVMAGQDQFLLCFVDQEAVSIADIADRLTVRASTVSKMADILERKGWIGRETDDSDARKVLVRLSETGCEMREAVRVIEKRLEAELFEGISRDEQMVSALAKLDTVLAQRLRRLR